MIKAEIIYINAEKDCLHLTLALQEGDTVGDALRISGLLTSHPEIEQLALGIFAKTVTRDTVVKNGDRIEIYRPLLIDPKQKRRDRAKLKKRSM